MRGYRALLRVCVACLLALAICTQPMAAQSGDPVAELELKPRAPEVSLWRPEFRKFHPVEWWLSIVFGVSTLAIAAFSEPREGPHGGVLFDVPLRDGLRLHDGQARGAVRALGDSVYYGLMLYPFVDAGIVWAIHRDSEVVWQMLAINLGAFAWAGFSSIVTEYLVGRARPNVPRCDQTRRLAGQCSSPNGYRSFFSGHVAMATTGAALTCAHHLSMRLYGGGADAWVCIAAAGLAFTTGATRILSDRHWATDVIVGWGVGVLAGYVWPRFFHYRAGSSPRNAGSIAFVPWLAPPDQVQAWMVGSF